MTDFTPHRLLGDAAPLDEIGALRRDAWGPLVGPDRADERFGIGAEDHAAWHVVICEGATLVAAGRLAVREKPTDLPEADTFDAWTHLMAAPLGFASRLSVRPLSQGQGLAARIIGERLTLARSLGLTQVWGETRVGHIHGLERHGYRLLGPSADESVQGEWHVMCATLDATGEAALAEATERRAFEAAVRAVARKAEREGGDVSGRTLWQAITGKYRTHVDKDAVFAEAERRGHITQALDGEQGGKYWTAGTTTLAE